MEKLKQIKSLASQMSKAKEKIATERDKLRELNLTLASLLEDVDDGLELLTDGIKDIERGIDELSKTL